MSDRWFTLLTLLIGILLGAVVSGGVDYWKTFLHISPNIRAHLLSLDVTGEGIAAEVALVNAGNRQGAVAAIYSAFPVRFPSAASPAAEGWLSLRDDSFKVTGVPTVLNPGDIQIVTVRGKIHPESVYDHSLPVDAADGDEFTKPDRRKNDLALAIRALNFKGEKYETRWRLGTVFFTPQEISSFRYGQTADVSLFEKDALSAWAWSPLDLRVARGRIPEPQPQPQPQR